MKNIRSVNEISGVLYKNDFINDMIDNVTKNVIGIKKIKTYMDFFKKELNIVIMIDKKINLLNELDNSLNKMECLLKEDFRFQDINVNIYILEK